MPISVNCQECGKSLRAPDALAGMKAKCPQCSAIVLISAAAVVEAEVIDEPLPLPKKSAVAKKPKPVDDEADMFDDAADDEAGSPADDRKPCPACGEMIMTSAAKCRFCGEFFDATMKRRGKPRSGKSGSWSSDDLRAVAKFQKGILIVLLVVNGKATRILQDNGIKVGLLGAKSSDL